jgi:hypothetical protein
MKRRSVRQFFVAAAGLIGTLMALSAIAEAADIDMGFDRCVDCIDRLKKQLAQVTFLGNLFTLVGAALAALGSGVAGLTKNPRLSWIAGLVGVVGAVTTAAPKTLTDRAEIQRKISLADQHRVHGEKTMRQISLLHDSGAAGQCEQYAIARFVDCSADEPPKEVPEIPVTMIVASDRNAEAKQPAFAGHGIPSEVAAAAAASPSAAAVPTQRAAAEATRPTHPTRAAPAARSPAKLGF